MTRQDTRWVLLFVLVIMVCGGGCMSARFLPQQQVELAAIGVDDHTRARLDGRADATDHGPKPGSAMRGRLLIVHGAASNDWWPGLTNLSPDPQTRDQLKSLNGIENIGVVEIAHHLSTQEQRRREQARLSGVEYKPSEEPIDLLATVKAIAAEDHADLVLFVTSGTKAGDFDAGLVVAQILTLGLAPTVVVTADATMSAVLLDAHTGYAYAITETQGDGFEMSSGWSRESNKRDQAAVAVAEAFGEVINRLEAAWPQMQAAYGGGSQ